MSDDSRGSGRHGLFVKTVTVKLVLALERIFEKERSKPMICAVSLPHTLSCCILRVTSSMRARSDSPFVVVVVVGKGVTRPAPPPDAAGAGADMDILEMVARYVQCVRIETMAMAGRPPCVRAHVLFKTECVRKGKV